jgi:hypothetical protein
MTKNKFVIGMSLTMLVALWGGGAAYAEDTSTDKPETKAEQIQSQNTRHRMPHSERRAAAARLKVANQGARDNEMARQVREHGQPHQPQQNGGGQ